MQTPKNLTTFALVMLITGAIDSIRNLPATALFGSTLIFYFIFAAVFFLIPAGLVAAELASTWTDKGGIYYWIRQAYGARSAFISIWLQWINTLVWYPTILSFIAGTAVYLLNPHLAESKLYAVTVILIIFWSLTLLNLKGITISAYFAEICAILGMVIPMLVIIGLFFIWLYLHKPLEIHLTWTSWLPTTASSQSWISLTAIMTAFLGIELACVHVKDVTIPQRTFPKALFYSVILILFTMIFGALAIAAVLPSKQINLVDGVMQAFSNFFAVFHLAWMMPVMTFMLLIGSLGSMTNWIISPAKGLMQAAQNGYLPEILKKENKHGVAKNILILQAVIVSFICLTFLFMPGVNGIYWLLTDLSTQLYMVMYLFMFSAAIVLRYKYKDKSGYFKIPGGKLGLCFVAGLGIIGTLVTLVIGFFPPTDIDVGGTLHFEIMFILGILLMFSPAFLIKAKKEFAYQNVVGMAN